MMMSLVLVAGLLLESGDAPKDAPKETPKAKKDFVIPEGTPTITLTPGTTLNVNCSSPSNAGRQIFCVKTEQGYQMRLIMPHATIEAPGLLVKSGDDIYYFQVDAKTGEFRELRFKDGQGKPGRSQPPCSSYVPYGG